jgi:hypothetical protein
MEPHSLPPSNPAPLHPPPVPLHREDWDMVKEEREIRRRGAGRVQPLSGEREKR